MKISFPQLLSERKVVVPLIQRDYAQGRCDAKATLVRDRFLQALFEAISRAISVEGHQLDLDFIYGYRGREGAVENFYPIDGQQRLTTLWLLFWYVAARESVSKEDAAFLQRFCYETRHSTNVFCEKLWGFRPPQPLGYKTIAKAIRDQPWYFESWVYDPGIAAMLVMLDDIEKCYDNLGHTKLWPLLAGLASPLRFYLLDTEELGLPDDLYIKMNSRGKPLTDFEYFKAGFLELIGDTDQKERFEHGIDGSWLEVVWEAARAEKDDKAKTTDASLMRLLNFLTDGAAYRKGIKHEEIQNLPTSLKTIYARREDLEFLMDALDAVARQRREQPNFWNDYFYYNLGDAVPEKVRLFFESRRIDLIEGCLVDYYKNARGFSLPEQLLLFACLLHLMNPAPDFTIRLRVIRNLISNSGDQLRVETIGMAFDEIHAYLYDGNLEALSYFKPDQIAEEKKKKAFISAYPDFCPHLYSLEDCTYFRSSVSVFEFDAQLGVRATQFLKHFGENLNGQQRMQLANLLLCFGDYTQDKDSRTNILAPNESGGGIF